MADQSVTITVRLRAKHGMIERLREAGRNLITPTRKEEGCISYLFHEDTKDQGLFLFFEIWRSQEALERHLETPYLKSFRKVLDETLAEPAEIIFWQPQEALISVD